MKMKSLKNQMMIKKIIKKWFKKKKVKKMEKVGKMKRALKQLKVIKKKKKKMVMTFSQMSSKDQRCLKNHRSN